MTHRRRVAALALGFAALVAAATPAAATGLPTARGVFDAASDTTPQLTGGETSPRGSATYTQRANGSIVMDASLTGLRPLTSYVVVAYKDGSCIPLPGVTAFPSPPFSTGVTGGATLAGYPVNPAAINPVGTLSAAEINSISIRQVVTTLNGTTVPDATQTEACDIGISH